MPNFKQLEKLRERYGEYNPELNSKKIIGINENLRHPSLRSAIRMFAFTPAQVSKYDDYFKKRKKAEVVLLFIDITSFSSKFINKTHDELATYLDQYYRKVLPIIGKHGGEIEKLIGDGIVCVFGEPFLSNTMESLHQKANNCAKELISTLKNTDFAAKIAIHFGTVLYYQHNSQEYYEYTMIGNALTDLFRLESISHPNCINFAFPSHYSVIQTPENQTKGWMRRELEKANLKGVSFNLISRIEFVG